jgi:DICT domain-containing protein
MDLREIIAAVEGDRLTLSLNNVAASTDVLNAIDRYFEPRHVTIRRTSTDHVTPKNVAILHDRERFLAASDMRELYRFVDPSVGTNTTTDIEEVEVPAVVRALDNTTFSGYGKERMITASRVIEKRAWRAGGGEIQTCFQRLSLARSQRRIYRKLVETGIDVHLFGVPDADAPQIGARVHGIDMREIAESWVVVFDPGEVAGRGDPGKAALLARVTPETDTYRGFWTYRESIVDKVSDRLESVGR